MGVTFEMFCFIDETHTDYRDWRRRRGYMPRGRPPTVFDLFIGRRYTMIAAANCYGFLVDVCMRGFSEISDGYGNNNTESFLRWFEHALLPHLGSFMLRERNSIIVLDNCIIHHKEEIERLAATKGCVVLWLPTYSPDYTIIETAFAKLKKKYCDIWSEPRPTLL